MNVSTTVSDVVVPSGNFSSYGQQRRGKRPIGPLYDDNRKAADALSGGHPKSKKSPIHPSMRK